MMDDPASFLVETGQKARNYTRQELPDSNPEEDIEQMWTEEILGEFPEAAVVGEEGTWHVPDDPDRAYLIDPLDGTTGARNGMWNWVTTAVTVLEDVEVTENCFSGTPEGSYIGQVGGETDFCSWNGDAFIDGEVRFTEVTPEDELAGEVDGTWIGPIQESSVEGLDDKRYISVYAGSEGRRTLEENFLWPIQDLNPDKVRTYVAGGSYTGASVGFGKTLVAGEPKPTKPTEAAGEVFASAMGASTSGILGEESEQVTVKKEKNGPDRTYTSVIASNDYILDEALEAAEITEIEHEYGEEFGTYREAGLKNPDKDVSRFNEVKE